MLETESGFSISKAFVRLLRGQFRKLGNSIGQYPWIHFGVTTLCCLLLCAGFLMAELNNDVRDGYTPLNAPSRTEQEAFVKFFNKEPYLTHIQVRARDGGSLLRLAHFKSAINLLDYLTNDFQVEFKGESKVMGQVCHPFCEENEVIRKFYVALEAKIRNDQEFSGNQFGSLAKLDYPTSSILNKDFFLGDHFYGVEKYNQTDWGHLTSIKKVEVIVFRFRNTEITDDVREFLKRWDLAVFDFSKTFNDSLIKMSIWSNAAISEEVFRTGIVAFWYLPPGIVMVLIFAVGTILLGAWLDPSIGLRNAKPWMAFFGVVCPLLATAAALGIIFLLGHKVKSVLILMPFLVLAIGVDDAFLIINAWQGTANLKTTVPERMGHTLANIGPSIALTSITNSVAFAIGAFTSTPAIRLLCLATSIAMAIDFVCELTFFCAALAISGRREVNDEPEKLGNSTRKQGELDPESNIVRSTVQKRLRSILSTFLEKYCKIVCSWPSLIVVVLFLAAYWSFSVIAVLGMRVELSMMKLWLKDSPMVEAMINRQVLFETNYPVLVLVNRPPNFADFNQSLEFTEMVETFEGLGRALGRSSTRIWIPDYKEFIKRTDFGNMWGDYDYDEYGSEESSREILGDFDPYQLPEFFQIADYAHWNAMVHWTRANGTIKIERFAFMISYKEATSDRIRVELMQKWREIAARYPQFEVTIWKDVGYFADQLMTMKSVTLTTVAIAVCSMVMICFLFIPNFWSVVVASISTASISFGVCGILSCWDVDLDLMSMVSIIMTIGFSVDYTAHISYHYCQHHASVIIVPGGVTESRVETMKSTLGAVGWPMIQAGVSTVIAVFPLCLVGCYMADVFMKTMLLGAVCGLLHGLFIVPVVLANVPELVNRALSTPSCLRRSLLKKSSSTASHDSDSTSSSPTWGFKRALSQKRMLRRMVSTNKIIPGDPTPDLNDSISNNSDSVSQHKSLSVSSFERVPSQHALWRKLVSSNRVIPINLGPDKKVDNTVIQISS